MALGKDLAFPRARLLLVLGDWTKKHLCGGMPARAFDTPEEKQRVAAILEQYNNDLTLTPEEDAEFLQTRRERTARHPLRTYFWLPAARAVTSGSRRALNCCGFRTRFSARAMREDDPSTRKSPACFLR